MPYAELFRESRLQGWKEIDGIQEQIITKTLHDLFCSEICSISVLQCSSGCYCFLKVAGTGCCFTVTSSRYAVGNVYQFLNETEKKIY